MKRLNKWFVEKNNKHLNRNADTSRETFRISRLYWFSIDSWRMRQPALAHAQFSTATSRTIRTLFANASNDGARIFNFPFQFGAMHKDLGEFFTFSSSFLFTLYHWKVTPEKTNS